jgi:hypothetical protein
MLDPSTRITQLAMLGLIGEYVGRMFLTVNKKPQFVVRDVERNDCAVAPTRVGAQTDALSP